MKKSITLLLTFILAFNIFFVNNSSISKAQVTPTKSAIITANTTYLRSERSTSSSKLKTLTKNNIVTVIGYKGSWLRVKSGTKSGYILSN